MKVYLCEICVATEIHFHCDADYGGFEGSDDESAAGIVSNTTGQRTEGEGALYPAG
jgi:hypothetical protein